MAQSLVIGVDGGGTHSRALAVRLDGTPVAYAEGASLNFLTLGMDQTRANLDALIRSLPGVCPEDAAGLSLALAALDGPGESGLSSALAPRGIPPERVFTDTDLYAALLGATLGSPGTAVACGTGSMVLCLDPAFTRHVRGGYGCFLGDEGSGFLLASDALRSAIRFWEGWGGSSALARAAEDFFHLESPRSLIERVYADTPPDPAQTAAFAERVLRLAENGERESLNILQGQMDALARQTASLPDSARSLPVCLMGGVFEHSAFARRLFARSLMRLGFEREAGPAAFPPVVGAVCHALLALDRLQPDALSRLTSSYSSICPLPTAERTDCP